MTFLCLKRLALAAVAGLVVSLSAPTRGEADAPATAAAFVGSAACAGCHQAEATAWRGSHHDLAMQKATESSVLGDFSGATFTYGDITSRFFKRDGKFFVNTDGPDGKLADFEIRYTFGVTPLQQYLIAFPDGRMQALGIAWDSRPKEAGGQRWFHLYPDRRLKAGDPVHWTGIDQTWNFQCAECHSTELRKNYDAASNTYATTWAEINVGCEACHGPGAAHVAWAERRKTADWPQSGGDDGLSVHFDEREAVSWAIDPTTGNARRSAPRTSAKELETCGVCHSRSGKIAEPWRPGHSLLETHVPSLLYAGLFEADGKSLDEVYNYAPFRQSKMFMAGVSCSDCHNPHSLKLVADGNAVCTQCHDEGKYAVSAHTHHAEGSAGTRCVACHMPVKTYMQVDPRHDHAFRVPRPDESVRFGTSNACNDCHADKDAAWAAAAIEQWFGPVRKGFQTWTGTFAAARAGDPKAAALLLKLATSLEAPSIVRATAFEGLADYPGRDSAAAAQRGLADPDPLVRLGALRAMRAFPVEGTWQLANGLLSDPVLAVRIEAAGLLATTPADRLSPADRDRLATALADYEAAQRVNADRPEHRVNLGNLYLQQGRFAEAEKELVAAQTLDPSFTPVYTSLAQLYAQQSRDADGERVLRDALTRYPDAPELHHALGLNLVRQHGADASVAEFARAAELDPADSLYAYVYAVALNAVGRSEEAIRVLEESHARHPADRDTLFALTTINRDAGRGDAALAWAIRLAAIDPAAQSLVDQLQRSVPKPHDRPEQ
ncbi:MAG: tetratricopeptide repeat protein [Rhodospirillales bacterium]|nr:tetratricopeptide repeat protein [Rhodospirillales bacterium]